MTSILPEKRALKKPRILIATGIFPPQVGGPATYSKLLLDTLPQKGFPVIVVSFGEVLRYPKILRHGIYFFKVLRKALSSDVVYAQDPVSVGFPALIASKILGKKFYLKIVGDYAWEQGTQRFGVVDLLDTFSKTPSGYPFFVQGLKRIQRFVAHHADTVIVPSNYLKTVVTNWGIEGSHIHVIYNAFQTPHDWLSRIEARKKLGIEYPAIISAGRLVRWKGFDTLIKLMPDIAREIPTAKLFIAGDGPDSAYLRKTIIEVGAEDSVIMLGKLSQSDLFDYIAASNLFVLNTSYEGLSHQLLEVMFLKTPILTTDVGGNPEVVESGKNGLLVTYNDTSALRKAIVELLHDQQKQNAFTSAGGLKLNEFSQDQMLGSLTKLFQ